MDFKGAQAALDSKQQQALHNASLYINGELNIAANEHDIVGAWADGAENSVMDVVEHADWNKMEVSAAMKGWLADQKSVLIFKQQDDGDAIMFRFEAQGDLDKIHSDLLADGIGFHTLAPHAGGVTVYVADPGMDPAVRAAVEKAATRYDTQATYEIGRAEFIGNSDDTGTDREQRDRARAVYEGIIGKSPVQGSAELWEGIRDRFGTGLEDRKVGGPATDKLKQYEGLVDSESYGEGGTGFLTVDGAFLVDTVGVSHNQIAASAGTSLNKVLSEGTARIYASSGFLGIEIRQKPSNAQVATLIKIAEAGSYEHFTVETTWLGRPSSTFVGEVDAKAVRQTVAKAFPADRKRRGWDEDDNPVATPEGTG